MKNLPIITVVITAYNRKEYIWKALKSVLDQNIDEKLYEVIVVKNFKDPDLDQKILSSGARIINSTNKALGGKFLEGVNESKGEIICFLEDDDYYYPYKLKTVLEEFSQDPELMFYQHPSDLRDVSDDRLISSGNRMQEKHLSYPPTGKKVRKLLAPITKSSVYNNSSYCIRKSAFDGDLGPFRNMVKACDDFLFIFLLSVKGKLKLGNRNLSAKTVFVPKSQKEQSMQEYLEVTFTAELQNIETYSMYLDFFKCSAQLELSRYYMTRAKLRAGLYGNYKVNIREIFSSISLCLKYRDFYLLILCFWTIISKLRKDLVLFHFFSSDGLRKQNGLISGILKKL